MHADRCIGRNQWEKSSWLHGTALPEHYVGKEGPTSPLYPLITGTPQDWVSLSGNTGQVFLQPADRATSHVQLHTSLGPPLPSCLFYPLTQGVFPEAAQPWTGFLWSGEASGPSP